MLTHAQDDNPIAENKRYTPRWNLQAHCLCRMNEDGTAYEGHVKDVSCSGACIATDQHFEIDQKVNLTLFLSEMGVVNVCSTVVWTKVNEIGIHFFNTSHETQETIIQHAVNANKELLADYWFKGWGGL